MINGYKFPLELAFKAIEKPSFILYANCIGLVVNLLAGYFQILYFGIYGVVTAIILNKLVTTHYLYFILLKRKL